MPDQREDVLNFIKYNGPVLPVQIAKHINTNILFSSAILSELVSRKSLKITHASIGGSPLYYLPGQEEKVDERLSKSISGKEKEAYQLIKEKKVLMEKNLEPWQRIALRNLSDFCIQINVKDNGNEDTFWKYHLVSDEDAKNMIAETMKDVYSKKEQIQSIVKNITTEEMPSKIIQETIIQSMRENIGLPEIGVDTNEAMVSTGNLEISELITKKEVQGTLEQPVKSPKLKEERKIDAKFYGRVLDFIKENNVEILKEEVVKKDKEIDFVVNISTAFGKLKYLIKAKNKAAINEADVSMAFSEGQIKKIPVIMLVNGKVNKKASLLVEQKMQGQLTLKQI